MGTPRTQCRRRGHPLTEESGNVYTSPEGVRSCRACRHLARLARITQQQPDEVDPLPDDALAVLHEMFVPPRRSDAVGLRWMK